jgi:hypothetical protein
VAVPSIVAYREAMYYVDPTTRVRRTISLEAEAQSGRIDILEASADEMRQVVARFDRVFVKSIDDALIEYQGVPHRFCTADGPAIRALCMLGHSDRGVSLERVLKETGAMKHLEPRCGQEFLEEHKRRGAIDLIQGVGLVKRTR